MNDGPPIRGGFEGINYEYAKKAIEVVKQIMPYLEVEDPIIRHGPGGEVHVDVPLMYKGYALDRIHYDPMAKKPSPKGRPGRGFRIEVNPEEAKEIVRRAISEAKVLEGAEFRDPESAWAIPICWNNVIIAHVKVSYSGEEIVPDYALSEELRRRLLRGIRSLDSSGRSSCLRSSCSFSWVSQ